MKQILSVAAALMLLVSLVACIGTSNANITTTENTAPQHSSKEQSFENVSHLTVVGHLQHIQIKATPGSGVVIRWNSDGSDKVIQDNKHVSLEFADPDWLDDGRPEDGFSVVSTIEIEVPTGLDTVTVTSTLGNISVSETIEYIKLLANTINGDIDVHGMVGVHEKRADALFHNFALCIEMYYSFQVKNTCGGAGLNLGIIVYLGHVNAVVVAQLGEIDHGQPIIQQDG